MMTDETPESPTGRIPELPTNMVPQFGNRKKNLHRLTIKVNKPKLRLT